jgi:hypothetical protein
VLPRILLHFSALVMVAALGLAGGAWLTWRQIQQERNAPPRPGQVLSGMVMNVRPDGLLDVLQWNGKRVLVALPGIRPWGRQGLVWLIDHATRQSVDVRVRAAVETGRVEGDVTYLGVNLAEEILRAGMAELAPRPLGGPDGQALAAAEAQAQRAERGRWARGAPPGR